MNWSLDKIDPAVARILAKSQEGKEVSAEEGALLFNCEGRDLMAVLAVADELRQAAVGDKVTYVRNRNINFTNKCTQSCLFCAFHNAPDSAEGYTLSVDEVAAKAEEAKAAGATEVCIQGGLNPEVEPRYYYQVCEAIINKIPDMHIHAFSPMEVLYASRRQGCSVREHLARLKSAGLGSMPGTAAEILHDSVRDVLCPGKLSTAEWVEVITTAHNLGIPTTATIMYGHIEEGWHRAHHLQIIRDIQKSTGGFTELVPLSFVHNNTELYRRGLCGPGASGLTDLKMHAIARIMLNGYVPNIQVSWLKLGVRMTQVCLSAGANDLGGTLMEDSISRTAGVAMPAGFSEESLQSLVLGINREPALRTTTYQHIQEVA